MPTPPHPLRRPLFAVLVLMIATCAAGADGPGFPNLDYPPADQGTVLSLNDPGKALSAVGMHRGYLFVPLGADHGGGQGAGAFAFYDVSDPAIPTVHFDSRDHPSVYHDAAGSPVNYVGDFAELHHMPVSDDYVLVSERRVGSAGYAILDLGPLFEDPAGLPQVVSRYSYPGVTGPTNYDGYSFALGWQGRRYLWGPTGSNGLMIVDTSDFANPQLIASIPRSALNNKTLRSAVPIGNLLVLTTSAVTDTFDTVWMDISDPANPQIINTLDGGSLGYQAFTYGSRLYGGGSPLTEIDFTDPFNPVSTTLNANPGFDRSEYGFGKDGFLFVGHYPGMTKWLLDGTNTQQVGAVNSGIVDDHAFITPLGNLIVLSSDHANDRKLTFGIHDHQRDLTPPAVNFSSPADGETGVHVKSRVGICFTDFVDSASINSGNIAVREFVTGTPVPGSYSSMFGIVNFAPDGDLLPDTTYEVLLRAGGVADQAGNAIAADTVVATFATGSEISTFQVAIDVDSPMLPGETADFSLQVDNPVGFSLEHAFDFGDGSPATPFTPATAASHTYTEAGNHTVTVSSRIAGNTNGIQSTAVQVVHNPLTAPPLQSSTVVYDAANGRVWNVNPDNDSVTAIDAGSHTVVFETSVGDDPKSLSLGPADTLWVANKGDATLSVIDRASGAVTATHDLPFASAPHGVLVDPAAGLAYVSLEATGEVARVDTASGAVTGTLSVGPWPRGLALDRSRDRLWVARFISPDTHGELVAVDTAGFSPAEAVTLSPVMAPDSLTNGRGIPNYLGALALSPDGSQLYVPAKKDNIFRGLQRDGLPLTFEHTVRSMAARIDLATGAEDSTRTLDFDNNDFATAAAFSPLGNHVFFVTNGSATVWVVDAYGSGDSFTFATGGLAPDGLVLSSDGAQLFVHNFMSRTVTVFNVGALCASVCGTAPLVATVDTTTVEALPPQVLLGKQLFYDSSDPRLSQESYMSCASCHLDGGHDGRTWDFSGFGEGDRNTIDLNGRGTGHGPFHWSANFDEVHDFEGQIRGLAGGTGLMTDGDFNEGTRSQPLGQSKAGVSPDLDALAAYIASLTTAGTSPHRDPDGSLSADAAAGRALFIEKNCASCHSGDAFTDSASLARHDVGTLTALSGERLGGPLDGLDTPTLRGLWSGAPYLHDGSAATLEEVLVERNIAGLHGSLFDLTAAGISQLAAYLRQIDDLETSAPTATTDGPPALTHPGDRTDFRGIALQVAPMATDPESQPLLFSATGLPPGLAIDPATGTVSGAPALSGVYTVTLGVRDPAGGVDSVRFDWTVTEAALAYADLDPAPPSGILREWWTGISGNPVSNLTGSPDYPDNPDGSEVLGLFEGPTNWGSSYGTRMHGYLVPPVSGDYTLAIASDDNSELWLGSNHLPGSGSLVAGAPAWTDPRQWSPPKYGEQLSAPIPLEAGKLYYIKALHKEGSGGDNLAGGWIRPGESAVEVIPGSALVPYGSFDAPAPPAFTGEPYLFAVTENSVVGSPVGSVAAGDPDPGQTPGFAIVSGNGSGLFAVDPASGELSVAGPLDYESATVHHLLVQATDDAASPLSATAEVTVTVTNVLENNAEVVLVELTRPGAPYEGHGNPALIGFDADPDGDGRVNALEVLQGHNVSSADAGGGIRMGTIEEGGKTYMTYEIDVDATIDGVLSFRFMAAGDVNGAWTEPAGPPQLVYGDAAIRTYRVRDDVAVDDADHRFMRVVVDPAE